MSKATARHLELHNLSFHHIEAWDLNSVLKLTAAAGVQFTVVFIDVSGSRRVGDVDNLIMKCEQVGQGPVGYARPDSVCSARVSLL